MSILLLVPHTDLKYARSERNDWLNLDYLDVDEVPSPVTVVSFMRALTDKEHDTVVMIAHGGPRGIILDEEEVLDYETLIPALRGRVQNLFLNTCESKGIADNLIREAGINVLCTIGSIDDRRAFATGSSLADWLDRGLSFEEASKKVTGPSQYRHWKASEELQTAPVGVSGYHFRAT